MVSQGVYRPHPIDAPGTDEQSWKAWPWLSTLPGGGLPLLGYDVDRRRAEELAG